MQKKTIKKKDSKQYTEEELMNLGIFLKNNTEGKKIKKSDKTD